MIFLANSNFRFKCLQQQCTKNLSCTFLFSLPDWHILIGGGGLSAKNEYTPVRTASTNFFLSGTPFLPHGLIMIHSMALKFAQKWPYPRGTQNTPKSDDRGAHLLKMNPKGQVKNNEANVLQNGPKIIYLWYISASFFLITWISHHSRINSLNAILLSCLIIFDLTPKHFRWISIYEVHFGPKELSWTLIRICGVYADPTKL